MDEQLQGLLDRIRQDGVQKAEAEAAAILEQARAEARTIVAEAEHEAAEMVTRAQHDADVFQSRSVATLEQAGRDFLLRLRRAIERVLQESTRQSVGESLTPEMMAAMLEHLAQAYAARDFSEHRAELLVSPEDQKRFVNLIFDRYRSLLSEGLDIRVDDRIQGGFKVSFGDHRLYHDFTVEAIAEALSQLLKSPLDDIVRRAAEDAVQEPA